MARVKGTQTYNLTPDKDGVSRFDLNIPARLSMPTLTRMTLLENAEAIRRGDSPKKIVPGKMDAINAARAYIGKYGVNDTESRIKEAELPEGAEEKMSQHLSYLWD